jgi:hypothetical protein
VRQRTEPAVTCEIRAGVAGLAPATLLEESRELRVSHHLPNDFTKGDKSASALTGNQHLNQGNRLTKASQGSGSSSSPSSCSSTHSQSTILEDLSLGLGAATRSLAPLFIAAPRQGDDVGPNGQEAKQPALKGSTCLGSRQRLWT